MDADALLELLGLIAGFVLTLFIFSFVLKDNPLYRIAVNLLVGVSAGYALVVAWQQVLWPAFEQIGEEGEPFARILGIVPLLLALLLVSKTIPQLAWLGNSAMATIIAVGAGVGLVGAVAGTLLPQILAVHESATVGLSVAVLTISTLSYFHFTGRITAHGVALPVWQRTLGLLGQAVITATLGAIFAGALSTSLVVLTERVSFYVEGFAQLFITMVP